MKNPVKEINVGELKLSFSVPVIGHQTLKDLGFTDEELKISGGNLRFVMELGGDNMHLFKVPTLEFWYYEKIGKSAWQVEFNGEVVSEKTDPSGHSTIILLNRKKMESLFNRHINTLIVRADFAEEIHLSAGRCYLHLFEHLDSRH